MKHFFLALILSVGAIIATAVGYWTQSRDLPVESRMIEVVGPVYRGGKLLVRWQVYRSRACHATKTEFVIDVGGVRWTMSERVYESPPGPLGLDTFISQTDVPEGIPAGLATLRVIFSYMCNPVHRIWPVVNNMPDMPIFILDK